MMTNKMQSSSSKNELIQRYDQFFGNEAAKRLIEAKKLYSKDQYIRINISKTSIQDIEKFLKKNRVKYSNTFLKNALKIEKSFFNISSSLPSLTGEIYMQDLASQIPPNCIDYEKIKQNQEKNKKIIKVLDMAASPGSKTTQIADFLKYYEIDYHITAIEPEVKRLTKLINNIQKQRVESIDIINVEGQKFDTKEKFEIILLDSPCSGNLIGDENWLEKRNIKGILEKADLQKRLLMKAHDLLKNEGILIYSTCSLEIEENEANVDWLLRKTNLKTFKPNIQFPFDTNPVKKFKGKKINPADSIRFMPYLSKTQGFFICCFIK